MQNPGGEYVGDLPLATDEPSGFIDGAMSRLREAAAGFESAYAQLMDIGPQVVGTAAEGEWLSLRDNAERVRATLSALEQGTKSAFDYAKEVFGLSAVRNAARGRIAGLGVIPLLPIAAVTGAIALLVAATNSIMQFVVNWRRAEAGKNPVSSGGGVADTVQAGASLVRWLIVGGVLYVAAPELLRIAKGGKWNRA